MEKLLEKVIMQISILSSEDEIIVFIACLTKSRRSPTIEPDTSINRYNRFLGFTIES